MLFYDNKAHKLSQVTFNIPMKDGKKFVEIDHQNWGGDTSNDVDIAHKKNMMYE